MRRPGPAGRREGEGRCCQGRGLRNVVEEEDRGVRVPEVGQEGAAPGTTAASLCSAWQGHRQRKEEAHCVAVTWKDREGS